MSGRNRHTPSIRTESGGQSLPEFLIAVPVFLFLILLIFQMILIYRAKTILDYATLEAARTGAVNGAKMADIERGLIRGLTPLYASDKDNVSPPLGVGVCLAGNTAWHKACQDVKPLNPNHKHAKIQVISPTKEAMEAFEEPQYDGRLAIPNDNLAYRHDDRDPGAEVNVQDANVLKIKVDYDYRLIVPFVDRVVRGASSYFKSDSSIDVDLESPSSDRFFRIPLQSHAVVRMQTPVYREETWNDLPNLADLQ